MIQTSQDWDKRRPDIIANIEALPYNRDLRRILVNIDEMVRQISKIEVQTRRSSNKIKLNEHLEKVNSSLATLENWLLLAVLYQ